MKNELRLVYLDENELEDAIKNPMRDLTKEEINLIYNNGKPITDLEEKET